MNHPLPEFPPLFPPGLWWRLFLSRLLAGDGEQAGISTANRDSGLRPREWMRVRTAGDSLLSFSVAGGASALKNRPSTSWVMAGECVRESGKFASTLATVYGKTPYFHLLKESLTPEILPGTPAENTCRECFRKVMDIILPEGSDTISSLKEELALTDNRIEKISKEYNKHFNPESSIIDALVRMGPDAIFPLLPTF